MFSYVCDWQKMNQTLMAQQQRVNQDRSKAQHSDASEFPNYKMNLKTEPEMFISMISVKIPSSPRRRNREPLLRSRCWGTSNSLENLESLILFMNLSFQNTFGKKEETPTQRYGRGFGVPLSDNEDSGT